MQLGRNFTSFGIILAKQAYQENDIILDLLLDKNLRLSALARSAKKSIKRFGGGLEPLQFIQFSIRSNKEIYNFDQLFSLESAQAVELMDAYRQDWKLLRDGVFILELMRDVLPKGEQEPWVYPLSADF